MFYDVTQAISKTLDDPSLIFMMIEENYKEVVESVIDKIDLNLCDDMGNNVLMCLLKNKYYNLVLKYINQGNIDINHQNNEGDTLMHLVVSINYVEVKDIINEMLNNRRLMLNLKNNLGETILDKSINHNYLYTTAKILNNNRFDNINLLSFKNMYEAYIKNNDYGKYSKLSNFTLIMDNLSKKKLLPTMNRLVNLINEKENVIKNDFFMSRTNNLEDIINLMIKETI